CAHADLHAFPTRRSSDLPNGYFVWKPELFGVETVEVLKGPNSLVFGASEAGGVVNLVTKRPRKEEALQMHAEAGLRQRLGTGLRSEEHTSELQSRENLVC